MFRKAPWGSKGEDTIPRYVMPRLPHRPMGWTPSWKKLCTHVAGGGGCPRASQVWKKKPDNWAKVNKSREELPYINDLTTSPAVLLIRDHPHSSSLGAHLCLTPTLTKQTDPSCALRLMLSPIINPTKTQLSRLSQNLPARLPACTLLFP